VIKFTLFLRDDNVQGLVVDQGKIIKDVILSPYTSGRVFVEFTDGSTNFWVPDSWHFAISVIDSAARIPEGANNATVTRSGGDSSQGFVVNMETELGTEADWLIVSSLELALLVID